MINYVVFCAWISSCITMFLKFFMLLLKSEVHSFSLLDSIPSWTFATIYLSVFLSMDIWVVSNLGPVRIKLLWTSECKSLHEYMFSLLWGKYLGEKCLSHEVCVCFTLYTMPTYFPKWSHHFILVLQQRMRVSVPLHPLQHQVAHLSIMLSVILICVSAIRNNVARFFLCFWPFVYLPLWSICSGPSPTAF